MVDAISPCQSCWEHYIAGLPAMVNGLHDMLKKAGVDDNEIGAEEFAGY
jgi:hypothetical protein